LEEHSDRRDEEADPDGPDEQDVREVEQPDGESGGGAPSPRLVPDELNGECRQCDAASDAEGDEPAPFPDDATADQDDRPDREEDADDEQGPWRRRRPSRAGDDSVGHRR
jgi:hypothetical protein